MPRQSEHTPRIFLCHASEDKPRVAELYHRLKAAGYRPWLDKYDLLPGQDWWREIEKIIRDPYNMVLVCLSSNSVTKRGVVQREIKRALDMLDEMPEDTIYLIPTRLELCEVPERLSHLHWVDLFESDGFEKLLQALTLEINKSHTTVQAIEYYSCFISYSHKDQDFTNRLYIDLQNKGIRCWFAPADMKAGAKIHDIIDQAIIFHNKLLLVLSEHSMKSEWVKTEIRHARQAEIKEKQQKLFPIRLVDMAAINEWECFDADTGKDLAVEVREYLIPDFSKWKDPDAYQQAFERLLRDLKAEDAKPTS